MAELQTMNILVAERKAEYLAKELSKFLSAFNEIYSDPDAEKVREHFASVTPAYLAKACGSVLAEQFTIRAESEAPVEFDFDVDALLPAIRSSLFDVMSGMQLLGLGSTRLRDPNIENIKE